MMTTIWKYPLAVTGQQTIAVPNGARVLSVQVQDGIPCLWLMVSRDQPKVTRIVRTIGTGHNAHAALGHTYAGTYQMGTFVGHVFVE